MLPTLRASLPYTLALAVLAYLGFTFVPDLALAQEIFVVIGVLLSGILVPVLMDVKALQQKRLPPHQHQRTIKVIPPPYM